jgi:uncharacterized protein YidB (DUF937 family)
MGLLDTVIGALGQGQGQGQGSGGGQGDLLNLVVGMLTQGGGAAGGAGGAAGGMGGLIGLVEKFHQGGLGEIASSWVGTGQNLPVSPDQLGGVLGHDTVSAMAGKLGLDHGDLLGQLSHLLPQVVDKLTPNGQLPQAGSGAGGLGDLAGMLGGLLNPR